MAHRQSDNHAPFLKIVYTKLMINGKERLIPLELYADGTFKPIQ